MTRLAFTIPADLWLSMNVRRHWADEGKRKKALRQLAFVTARNARVKPYNVAHVAAFIGYPSTGRADPNNAAATVKPLLDGLTDAGVWPDDDSTHVIGPTYLRGPKSSTPKCHEIELVLTEQEVPW